MPSPDSSGMNGYSTVLTPENGFLEFEPGTAVALGRIDPDDRVENLANIISDKHTTDVGDVIAALRNLADSGFWSRASEIDKANAADYLVSALGGLSLDTSGVRRRQET